MKRIPMKAPNVLALLNTMEGVWPAEAVDPSKPFKWQTRRVVRVPFGKQSDWTITQVSPHGNIPRLAITTKDGIVFNTPSGRLSKAMQDHVLRPRHQPGEVLAVGEMLRKGTDWHIYYAADNIGVQPFIGDTFYGCWLWPWKNKVLPSIFMPVWAARMWVQVKAVRVEQLHRIGRIDQLAEGVDTEGLTPNEAGWIRARQRFQKLWESIHGAGSWPANPWVEVYEIMRVARPNGPHRDVQDSQDTEEGDGQGTDG